MKVKITVLLAAVIALVVVACGNESEERPDEFFQGLEGAATMSSDTDLSFVEDSVPLSAAMAPPSIEMGEFSAPEVTGLQVTGRRVIANASVSIEVELVQQAVSEVRGIAEGLGGFIEQLSSSGGDDTQRANITIRVPEDQFFTTLERIKALGQVRSENVGSEDVTEQFIDLEARLNSALREEQSYLSLLEKTETVSEILTVERELFRVRSEIERLQGQINFLERRVALATIIVSLFTPAAELTQPPSASLVVEASNVTDSVDEVKGLVATLGGELDGVFISVRDDKERADLTLRVFAADFHRTLSSIESLGLVLSKEIREGATITENSAKLAEKPEAPIAVTLIEVEATSSTGLVVAIVAPLGSVAFAIVMAILVYTAFRMGRKRSQTA